MPTLYIGNKNYSSWSLRPWLLARQAGIPFTERRLSLDFAPGSAFKAEVARHSPAGRVPVWVDDDGFAIWDTLAIAETLAERHPALQLWPAEARDRARARSVCAEMHSGFSALRTHCPMNVELQAPELGARILREHPAVATDLQRIDAMWSELLEVHGGPFLFGARATVPDAYYAPVVLRLRSYGLPVSAPVAAYIEHQLAQPALHAWVTEALTEQEFLAEDEPYRQAPAWQK